VQSIFLEERLWRFNNQKLVYCGKRGKLKLKGKLCALRHAQHSKHQQSGLGHGSPSNAV
jgi:hypothetical protein